MTASAQVRAQLVEPFNPGVDRMVFAFAEQTDGKVVIGGVFSRIDNQPRKYLARLNADGSLDASFNLNADDIVTTLIKQADGRILIGGRFSSIGGQSRHRLARLNPDGSLDLSFSPNAHNGIPDIVYSLAVQPDGRILAGGDFRRAGFSAFENYRAVERFNPNGSLDASFNANTNGSVYTLAAQADGRILIGGGFSLVGGQERRNIARLLADGSLDASFNANADGPVETITIQKDGRLLVGGRMIYSAPGQNPINVARLLANGSLDSSFTTGGINGAVYSIVEQPDGRILIGGKMIYRVGEQAPVNFARLNKNGTFDTSYNSNVNGPVESIAVQADNKVLISGGFSMAGGQPRFNIARLVDGQATSSINPQVPAGPSDPVTGCQFGFSSLGGVINSDPSIGVVNNRIVAFARGTDGAIYFQTSSGGAFSGWNSLGGISLSSPMTIVSGAGLSVEVVGTDNNRYFRTTADGVNFSNWTFGTAGGQTTSQGIFNNNLYTFLKGTGSQPHLCIQVAQAGSSAPTVTEPTVTPTPTPAPTPVPAPIGAFDPVTGCPAGFTSLGGVINSDPSAAVFNNRVYVFARGTDGAIYFQTSSGGAFSGWNSLGGISLSSPMTIVSGAGLSVEVVGTDNNRYFRTTADGVNFIGWIGGTVNGSTIPTTTLNGMTFNFLKGSGSQPHLCVQTQ